MVEKIEGATNKCGSCGELTVCRKITYEGKEKLQWQNHDNNEAHYGFDFKTKKSWCKSKGKETTKEESKGIDFEKLMDEKEPTPEQLLDVAKELTKHDSNPLNNEALNQIYNDAAHAAITHLVRQAAISNIMDKAGIKHPSRVAFTHEVMEDLRN